MPSHFVSYESLPSHVSNVQQKGMEKNLRTGPRQMKFLFLPDLILVGKEPHFPRTVGGSETAELGSSPV